MNTTRYFPDNITDYAPWVAKYGLLHPYGECQCGCGRAVSLATQTNNAEGRKQGQPVRYVRGHQIRIYNHLESPNPSGLCMCGCGQPAPIATQTNPKRGRIEGQPMRFIATHFKSQNRYASVADHFWAYCARGKPDECWDWQASLTAMGYGHFSHGSTKHLAHRTSWELHFGPIPDGYGVLHKCDRRCCNNPAHLFLGTQADNVSDATQKGRMSKGTDHYNAKLNPDAVREIRQLYADGKTPTEIARQFNVVPGTIRPVLNGKTWTHVT